MQNTTRVIKVTPMVHRKVKVAAARMGIDMNAAVDWWASVYLENHGINITGEISDPTNDQAQRVPIVERATQ